MKSIDSHDIDVIYGLQEKELNDGLIYRRANQ
jgi:hypothetical protein